MKQIIIRSKKTQLEQAVPETDIEKMRERGILPNFDILGPVPEMPADVKAALKKADAATSKPVEN